MNANDRSYGCRIICKDTVHNPLIQKPYLAVIASNDAHKLLTGLAFYPKKVKATFLCFKEPL